jgi:SPP1 family phage portal protein
MLQVEEIQRLIEEDRNSRKKALARKGQDYYEGRHDILKYKIYYYDADGKLKEDKFKSNIRISHPFFTELVDQQVQYMLSGDGNVIRSDVPELQAKLDEYFDDDFYSEIYDLLTGCVSKGFEYLSASIDKNGKTRFQCSDSMGVVEVRAKDTDDGCEYYIYWYIDRIDKNQKAIKRIQVWDSEYVYFYTQVNDGKIEPDNCIAISNSSRNYRPHTIYTDENGKQFGKGFGFIPFWRLDNGRKQFSGIKPIKALIDDYDLMACSLSNNLQDFTDALYVVSGFQGHDLDEMIQNIKAKKHIGVDSQGSVDIKTVDIPYQARVAKLELDEKNIYRFGMGFNSAQVGDGNITNIVIKSRYALLDLKCNKLEIRLRRLLRKLIDVVLDEINRALDSDYQQKDVYFDFKREVMTNAQDNAQIELTDAQKQQIQINIVLSLSNILPDETIIQIICEILDLNYEEIKDKIPDDEEAGNQYALNLLKDTSDQEGDLIE